MAQTVISRTKLSRHLHQPRFSDLTLTQPHSDNLKVNTNSSRVVREPRLRISATGMQVVHIIKGRIRIKATEASFSSECQTITQYLQQVNGVKSVTTHERTHSLVVSFDEGKLSQSEMLEILQKINIQTTQDAPPSDPLAAWKSGDFWQEQTISLIPLLAGLAVTSRLGVSGLASIPVYMITAETMRKIIDYVKPRIAGEMSREQSNSATTEKQEPQENLDMGRFTSQTTVSHQQQEPMIWSDKVTYSVIHQIPGRIRFHLPLIASDRAYGRRLEKLLNNDPIVKSVRINSDAASIVINYKPNAAIAISHWVNLMELAVEIIAPQVPVGEIAQPQPPESQSSQVGESEIPQETTMLSQPFPEIEPLNINTPENQIIYISSWWGEMKFSALSYSLNFMANLPL